MKTEYGIVKDKNEIANMPEEYRTAVAKILSGHAVNELRGALVFDEPAIRLASTPKFKWMVSRNTMEEFGHHILFSRLAEDIGVEWKDKKPLSLFDYPMMDWIDFGAIKAIVDIAEIIELEDLKEASYLPLRSVAIKTFPEEMFHVGLGRDILSALLEEDPENRKRIQDAINKLFPEVLAFFGSANSKNNELFTKCGLKKRTNTEMRKAYIEKVREILGQLGLAMPAIPEKYAREVGN